MDFPSLSLTLKSTLINHPYVMFLSTDAPSLAIQAIYTTSLTTTSSKYFPSCIPPDYYYEAIEVNVVQDGNYTFRSHSKIYIYGYLYQNKFDPFVPSVNLVGEGNFSGCKGQFQLNYYLRKQITYILVVATLLPTITDSFSITVFGPNSFTVKHIGEYIYHVH